MPYDNHSEGATAYDEGIKRENQNPAAQLQSRKQTDGPRFHTVETDSVCARSTFQSSAHVIDTTVPTAEWSRSR